MKVGFQHPDTGIPCIGIWDIGSNVLQFDFEDFEEAERHNTLEDLKLVQEWCIQNSINCYSEDQGNRHLRYLGINERLDDE